MTDIFREVREQVSAEDAARHYGLTFDRKGWALCPFHADKHPSMSFRNGRFRCWVCDVGGDSIDFTSRLLGLEPMAAVERLNVDFALSLPLHRKPTQAEARAARRRLEVAEAHRAFEEWRSDFINRLNAAFREGHRLACQRGRPVAEPPLRQVPGGLRPLPGRHQHPQRPLVHCQFQVQEVCGAAGDGNPVHGH